MSLIIKGVNLPEKCESCPCYDYIDYVCRADDCFAPFDVENPEERSEHCPLIEIPTPHGRLIDADELVWFIDNHIALGKKWVEFETIKDMINSLPTIIEAEVSE